MGDYTVSSRSAPNAVTSVLRKAERGRGRYDTDPQRRRQCECRGRVCRGLAVIQARNASNILFSQRSWRGKQQILL